MGAFWTWLRGLTSAEAEEARALTDQFFITLRAYAAGLPPDENPPEGLKLLRQLLEKKPANWSTAYEIEQLLIHYYDPTTLQMELGRRVLESEKLLPGPHRDWYRMQHKSATTPETQRVLFLRLINDLQWRYTVNEAKRTYSKQIMRRTSGILLIAILVTVPLAGGQILEIGSNPDFSLSWESMLLASFAGSWGAAFSTMVGMRERLEKSTFDEVKFARGWPLLIARNLIGVGAALILYFFLQAGMLSGSAFPVIEQGVPPIAKDIALLVVWCFIAGFSEKLVPHLLGQAESRAHGEDETDKLDVPRPGLGAAAAQQAAVQGAAREAGNNENERQE